MMHVMVDSIFENLLLFLYLLNKDTSFNIPCILLKFGIHILEYQLKGSVSQILYSLFLFYAIKIKFEKITKS